MRRVLLVAILLGAAGTAAVLSVGAGEDDGGKKSYWVQLDNAFGLVEGADVKVGGVRAGKIQEFDVDRKARKALVKIQLEEKGFDSFRTDVFCETRQQSTIGEYFIDCQPGKARRELRPGSTIPVSQTATVVPQDLVNNILRLPYAERLRIILMELGTGVASRAQDINDAIRRGVPALRETDRVLAILAEQNQVIKNLIRDGDEVITALADNKEDVGRFIVEANDTARASAARQAEIAGTWRQFPGFLRELRPTMASLGRVADEQTPALRNLQAASGRLERFFNLLGPFSDASRPAIRSLGETSKIGRKAVRDAAETVGLLAQFAKNTPELGRNLAIILEALDDRDNAVEKDPRSPGGKGYTGLEALLQYVFDTVQSINIFDQHGYILKATIFLSEECSPYTDAARVKENPKILADCMGMVGPSQPGVNQPDPGTKPAGGSDQPPIQSRRAGDDAETREPADSDPATSTRSTTSRDADATASRGKARRPGRRARAKPVLDRKEAAILEKVLNGTVPPTALPRDLQTVAPGIGSGIGAGGAQAGGDQLLDYLMAP